MTDVHVPIYTGVSPMGIGEQRIYEFDNGYGASVVSTAFSYGGPEGLYELAILEFNSDGKSAICYDTPIADDVIGYLSEDGVQELLTRIKELTV